MYRMDEEINRDMMMTNCQGDKVVTLQMWRKVPAGSPTPMITPSSTADPSQIRPALLPLSTMIQLTAMSATRMHRGRH